MKMPTQRDIVRLAAVADVDPRSARKALIHGPAAVRGRAGARIAEALEALGISVHPEPIA